MSLLPRKLGLFTMLLAVAISARAAETDPWRYVHPESKTLMGLDWAKLRNSDFGRWLQRQWVEDASLPGAEFLDGIRDVVISSPGTTGSAEAEPPLLIALQGNFPLPRIKKVLEAQGAHQQLYGTIVLYRPKVKSEPSFALVSDRLILIGDITSIYAAIERTKMPISDSPSPAVARARELAARFDGWALLNGTGANQNFLLASMTGPGMAAAAQGIEAGLTVKNGLSIDATIGVKDERAARALQASLNKLVRTSLKDKTNATELDSLLQRMHVTVEKATVAVSVHMNPQEVAESMKLPALPTAPLTAQNKVTVAGVLPPKPVPAAVLPMERPEPDKLQPAPPPRRMIRILGLEEGVREIPFDSEPPSSSPPVTRPAVASAPMPASPVLPLPDAP